MGDWADALVEATTTGAPESAMGIGGEDLDGSIASVSSPPCVRSALSPPTRRGTPLAPLRHAPCLLYFDLMLVDSTEGSEGLLDNRLIEDLAQMERLEEVGLYGPVLKSECLD